MAHLPNADLAFVTPDKITDYVLEPTHLEGGPKADFLQRFGFSPTAPDKMAFALLDHARAHDAVPLPPTQYGAKFEVSGPLRCPDGRMPVVKTVWIIDAGEVAPRFITLVPD